VRTRNWTLPLKLSSLKSFLFILTFLGAAPSLADDQGPLVEVTKTAQQSGGVTYHYSVTNHTEYPVHSLFIGNDLCRGSQYELSVPPVGWAPSQRSLKRSVVAPKGWTAKLHTQEEGVEVSLHFGAQSSARAIGANETLSGFSVTVSTPDATYESGHWGTAHNGGGGYSNQFGKRGRLAAWQGAEQYCR
jgi:hypothetical protein